MQLAEELYSILGEYEVSFLLALTNVGSGLTSRSLA